MSTARGFLPFLALTVLMAGACVKPYPDMRLASSIRSPDLDPRVHDVAEGIFIHDQTSTVGLFPTGVAVVRVQSLGIAPAAPIAPMRTEPQPQESIEPMPEYAPEPESPASPEPFAVANQPARLASYTPGRQPATYELFPFRSYEATYWTELFDSTQEIRDVVLLHSKSIRQPETDLQELASVAQIMHAGVLLIYGFDNVSQPQTCQVTGLVYDVKTNRLVASIQQTTNRSGAMLAAQHLRASERPQTEVDWGFYTDEVASRAFEAQFRQVVWDMIARDMPSGGQQSNPYTNPKPPYPDALPLGLPSRLFR